jgi:hypothetical protein
MVPLRVLVHPQGHIMYLLALPFRVEKTSLVPFDIWDVGTKIEGYL